VGARGVRDTSQKRRNRFPKRRVAAAFQHERHFVLGCRSRPSRTDRKRRDRRCARSPRYVAKATKSLPKTKSCGGFPTRKTLCTRLSLTTFEDRSEAPRSSVRAESEIRRKSDEIASQNEELRRLSNTKDTLYSVVAHDLRGPIGSAEIGRARGVRDTSQKRRNRFPKRRVAAAFQHERHFVLGCRSRPSRTDRKR